MLLFPVAVNRSLFCHSAYTTRAHLANRSDLSNRMYVCIIQEAVYDQVTSSGRTTKSE